MKKTTITPNVYTLADVEKAIDAGHYEHAANEFLRLTGSTLEVRYLRTGLYFGETDEKQKHDIYEFRIRRGTREYVDTFGDSLQNTWERFYKHRTPGNDKGDEQKTFLTYLLTKAGTLPEYAVGGFQVTERRWKKEGTELATWEYAPEKPTAYSILAGMQTCDVGTFDDFLAEFGFEITSKQSYEDAQRTYNAVVRQYDELCKLYNDKELQALASIV